MPKDKARVDKTDKTEEEPPLEDQTRNSADEDVLIEGRKPDLGEIEEDESEE